MSWSARRVHVTGASGIDQAKGEIRDQYLDSGKARRVLGWTPRFTLDEGLKRTIAWYRDYLGEPGDPAGARCPKPGA